MHRFPDNSKYTAMVLNRPSLNLIPESNKRILAQGLGIRTMILGGIASLSYIVLYKYFVENSSLYLIKTKKKFNFESDPYTGKVKCTYTDVPNKQYEY